MVGPNQPTRCVCGSGKARGRDVECGRGEVVDQVGLELCILFNHELEPIRLCLGAWQKGFICQSRTDMEWSKF